MIRSRHAFTLVELVTVIVILAITAMVAGGPVLIYMSTMRGGGCWANFGGHPVHAANGVSSGRRSWVVFNTGTNSYRLYSEDANNPGKAGRQAVTHPFDQSSAGIQLGSGAFSGVTISAASIGSGSEIEFDNFGVPYDTAGIAISAAAQISLSTGNSITVQPVSGYAEVQ